MNKVPQATFSTFPPEVKPALHDTEMKDYRSS